MFSSSTFPAMLPFKIDLPLSPLLQLLVFALWLAYLGWYWRALVRILAASRFDSTDKILWFLVITLAPLIGLLTFQVMCPPQVLNAAAAPPP